MSAPDFRLEYPIKGFTQEQFDERMRRASDNLRSHGVTWARATVLPSNEDPQMLIMEGWKERPDEESPMPTMDSKAADAGTSEGGGASAAGPHQKPAANTSGQGN
jgi:hypothetical protein